MRIITPNDMFPSDEVLMQMLAESREYLKSHSWIKYYVEENIVCSEEYPNGIPYFYGQLRKIRKERSHEIQ